MEYKHVIGVSEAVLKVMFEDTVKRICTEIPECSFTSLYELEATTSYVSGVLTKSFFKTIATPARLAMPRVTIENVVARDLNTSRGGPVRAAKITLTDILLTSNLKDSNWHFRDFEEMAQANNEKSGIKHDPRIIADEMLVYLGLVYKGINRINEAMSDQSFSRNFILAGQELYVKARENTPSDDSETKKELEHMSVCFEPWTVVLSYLPLYELVQ
jgi:hypothetical protein